MVLVYEDCSSVLGIVVGLLLVRLFYVCLSVVCGYVMRCEGVWIRGNLLRKFYVEIIMCNMECNRS